MEKNILKEKRIKRKQRVFFASDSEYEKLKELMLKNNLNYISIE